MQQQILNGFNVKVSPDGILQSKFIVPPFSVLDTRQEYWQERKRLWISLGIQSELGREANYIKNGQVGMLGMSLRSLELSHSYLAEDGSPKAFGGTSIFDPVLCELVYKWFCLTGGCILDPFAGGSVRGIVAGVLGNEYVGIELNRTQVEANIRQAEDIVPDRQPKWIVGDSYELDNLLADRTFDLIFSCPPYHNLERYTDDPRDLSNMPWDDFKARYRVIIHKCLAKLADNRFACFVVSEVRNKAGIYKGLMPYTIDCFQSGGANYYNEMVLINVVGNLSLRAGRYFRNRKIGRTHQNILVFYKGDIRQIPKLFNDVNVNFGC